MFGVRPSIIFARPSAAPHIALRSSWFAAFWRSIPAFWISPSAAPRAIVARTVVPGQRGRESPGPIDASGPAEAPAADGPTAVEALGTAPSDGSGAAFPLGPGPAPQAETTNPIAARAARPRRAAADRERGPGRGS